MRNESNPAKAYVFGYWIYFLRRVFGPHATSQEVYEVVAKPVVKAAMEGVNGTVFAYGVTSSGKTHTMHANITRTNHIMWTMGTDFKYQYAHTWFRQMDKLIHYVNKDGRVNALYSTPSIYTDVKYAMSKSWPLKTDDYFSTQ
ncbi:hypothetical protein CRYUN_Cryun09bG0070600 [Craigia yunnanensis]